ncbi:MAG: porin family protein, partial [Methylococcaceae bacterium]
LVSPQAVAGSKAERMSEAANAKVEILEAQLRAMQDEIAGLKAQVGAPAADAAKVQELDQWMASVKSAPVEKDHHDNTLSFRGGYARNDNTRNGVSIASDVTGSQLPLGLPGGQPDKDGWYIGAGFDFSLTDDVWGAMDNTQVLAELMFDYKEFAGAVQGNLLTQQPTSLAGPTLEAIGAVPAGTTAVLAGQETRSVTVNQLTVSAAPKVKFMKDSAFRPWIIPVGLAIQVISPPSESITVLNPAMVFGAGADYRIWKDIFIGADARYYLAGGAADGVNTDGMTAGGYIGIGF